MLGNRKQEEGENALCNSSQTKVGFRIRNGKGGKTTPLACLQESEISLYLSLEETWDLDQQNAEKHQDEAQGTIIVILVNAWGTIRKLKWRPENSQTVAQSAWTEGAKTTRVWGCGCRHSPDCE